MTQITGLTRMKVLEVVMTFSILLELTESKDTKYKK